MRFLCPLSLFVGAFLLGNPALVGAQSSGEGNSGETHLLSKPDQLGREYIHFAGSMDGVVQGGRFHAK